MIVYWILVVMIFISIPLNKRDYRLDKTRISGNDTYLLFVIIILTLVMGLRGLTVGTDTAPYARAYLRIGTCDGLLDVFSSTSSTAPVYATICWLLNKITPDPQAYVFVSSIVIHLALFFLIRKKSELYYLSAFLYLGLTLFYYGMNGNRQTVAMLLILNGLVYLQRNIKDKKGWMLILLSMGTHITSILLLISIVGMWINRKVKDKKVVIAISVVAGALSSLLIPKVATFASNLFPHYSIYMSGKASVQILEASSGGRIVVVYLFLAMFLALDYIMRRKKTENDSFYDDMIPMMVFGVTFGIINCRNALINRLTWYFIALFITYIPHVIVKYDRTMKFVLILGVVVSLSLYNYIFLTENQSGVVPYVFFWQ